MPEVVEVCITALYLKHFLSNKKITNINILNGRYKRNPMKKLSDVSKHYPLTVNNIDSKGKFIWFEFSDKNNNNVFMLNTLGLEGGWSLVKSNSSNVEFCFENNLFLYFSDTRNFGTIEFTYDRQKLDDKLNELGDDLLKNNFTEAEFRIRLGNVLKKKHGGNIEIIKVLMDQKRKSGIGSGIGNYLSVESLYRAKISPYKTALEIYNDIQLCSKLSKSIKYIIKLSFMTAEVGYVGELDNHMIEWVKTMRKSSYNIHPDINIKNNIFTFNVYRKKKDNKGNDVVGAKIIPGRTTYWCPSVQL